MLKLNVHVTLLERQSQVKLSMILSQVKLSVLSPDMPVKNLTLVAWFLALIREPTLFGTGMGIKIRMTSRVCIKEIH